MKGGRQVPSGAERETGGAASASSPRHRRFILAAVSTGLVGAALLAMTRYESYLPLYDAEYVGSATCGECHTQVFAEWKDSPHAKMLQAPSAATVVGDFEDHAWSLPGSSGSAPGGDPVARMRRAGEDYSMSLLDPGSGEFRTYPIEYVVGYQYRQVYLHREASGVLRRLPLQWSVERQEFFPYWNLQEGSTPSAEDLLLQMRSTNSAWNLFCARCHVTKLDILERDAAQTRVDTRWVDDGIACEACHGPGGHHVSYFSSNRVNRLAAFLNNQVRGQPVAYIASAAKMSKGQALSVCGRCHGPDIMMASTEAYRAYEPGYSRSGRINDLSSHFKEFPLQPGRTDPTVECWDDGRPKGIGMLLRSFIESACYAGGEVRCHDCHQPHANKLPIRPGLLEASEVSNDYCLKCHGELREAVAAHSHHPAGSSGSFCYDCHMPHDIQNLVSGVERFARGHDMSSIPDPAASTRFGIDRAPNACNECHAEESPEWAAKWMREWWKR
jgi:hypothetical protein